MKVLVVGAGAVGQVYGYYLGLGGAEVTFYVKEKYKAEVSRGLTLFPMNEGENPKARHFKMYQTISSNEEVAATLWDLVIITLPSDVLYTPWLPEFAKHVSKSAHIVSLQPGMSDKKELEKYFAPEKIILGVITLIAYSTPLGTIGPKEKGMAYWFPPIAKAPFDGNKKMCAEIVQRMSTAGFPCAIKPVTKKPVAIAFAATFLSTFIFTLENNDWKLHSFQKDKEANILTAALKESFAVVAKKFGVKSPPFLMLLSRLFYSTLIRISLWLMPFDLETYLQVHFTKVGPQMKRNMQELLDEAKKHGVQTPTLLSMKF